MIKHKREFKIQGSLVLALLIVVISTIFGLYIVENKNVKTLPFDKLIVDKRFYEELVNKELHKIKPGYFSVTTPKDYKFIKQRGIDSFVGLFANNYDTISFDYGWHSYDFTDELESRTHRILEEKIDGKSAIIVIPNTENGIVGLYIDELKGGNKLAFFTNDSNLNNKLKIFRSVKFN